MRKALENIGNNIFYIAMLAVFPILSTSNNLINSLVISSCLALLLFSSTVVSFSFRSFISNDHKEVVYFIISTIIISFIAILLHMFSIELYSELKLYVCLLVISGIILTNNEVFFTVKNIKILDVLIDNGKKALMFALIICFMGGVREIFGKGTLLGYNILPENLPKILLFQTSAGAYFLLAFVYVLGNMVKRDK